MLKKKTILLIVLGILLLVSAINFYTVFPMMPIAFLLLPAVILAGVVWLVYRLVKKKR